MDNILFEVNQPFDKYFKKYSLKVENMFMEEYEAFGISKKVTTPENLSDLFRMIIPKDMITVQECMYAIYFNTAKYTMGYSCLSVGGINATVVDPRLLLSKALLCGCSSIAICHNHPSGNLKPSSADIEITSKIKTAASLLDISLLDHLILTESEHFSFLENNLV